MTSLGSLDAAREVVSGLLVGGVRRVVVCPGSRSAPLAYALAEAEGRGLLELVVRIDERVGGFTALGAALSSGRPTAVLTTSGTAVGNLLPAVMEANHAEVPLIVLSADRPEELHGTGANQTTEQLDLFGEHVRFATSVAAGESPSSAVRTALSAASGLLPGVPSGPAQLNVCFREPLVPADGWAPPAGAWEQPPSEGFAYRRPAVAALGGLPPRRTVVMAGHGAGPLAEAFAAAHGLPLLAEPSSNARFGSHAVGPYRVLLDAHPGEGIERVVLFGRPTLSRPVTALLARADVETALFHPRPVAWFEEGRRREQLIADLDELSEFAGRGAEGWLDTWLLAGAAAQEAMDRVLAAAPLSGPRLAQLVWQNAHGQLVLGSSNGIRDVDLAASPATEPGSRVFANRGLAGIDGTVSTATGLWLGNRVDTTLFLGDLTFLHDAGGLLLGTGEAEPSLRIVVLNDAGGAIFGLLEHGRVGGDGASAGAAAAVERLFGTPHKADLRALAAAYGVRHTVVRTTAEAAAALAAPRTGGREIIEARVDRAGLRGLHARVRAAVAESVAPQHRFGYR
ncbi:2-succinyl-5-enolpyruvyl-6-hydroxy-3-cyclohexene-1-carboxylic-acid synthase [Sinomonas sp. ASV322]|uniref:2-succinyl-5-enolpyruvyl-6-hydroxy-3- cyclohexene-1-carboxylic-acid synthase n=1 Tax=Sinomonas sp. ASV322 TaxID=3041920 RepID=UPI0027DE1BAB|nr:2-succinyl-5-enolpyruvyl-6-hydroxy-3-cyclohexene-1-carboxylic-acid synthase [Sinomonas sp. ASV322]MDQ4501671.1 2-succinyl-5-enolpyruvyl-6-hydroxy-3-cyclohexene-1-carboxylic-acid synthase [Sinomonas sp. ASV322]